MQMESLMKSVDEELNFSKKANKARVQKMLQQQRVKQSPSPPSPSPSPLSTSHQPPLDLDTIQGRFEESEITKTMTVHHQLSAMERYTLIT